MNNAAAATPVVINRHLAHDLFGDRDPVGQVYDAAEPRASKPFNSGGEQHCTMMHPELGSCRRGHRIMAKKWDWRTCIELLVHKER